MAGCDGQPDPAVPDSQHEGERVGRAETGSGAQAWFRDRGSRQVAVGRSGPVSRCESASGVGREDEREHEETKGMYEYPSPLGEHGVADTGEFSPDGDTVMYTPDTALVGRELQRQQAAWEKVESCRADGGSDCMKYSATATADEEDGKVAGDMASDASGSSVVPSWVVPVVLAGAGVLVLAGVVLAVVLVRRMRRARMRACRAGWNRRWVWCSAGPVWCGAIVCWARGAVRSRRWLVSERRCAGRVHVPSNAGSKTRSATGFAACFSAAVATQTVKMRREMKNTAGEGKEPQ